MPLARTLISMAVAIAAQSGAVAANSSLGDAVDPGLFDLSLEQLMDVVITSVSKREQLLSNTAAAVHVITAEDIRRSGATSLPEALRLAPGVHVARFSNNRWSVSIRGFAGRYANKLLVLQDGRSLYTPLYSGVFWEFQDIPLETIQRIEIVRGPGASIWGANAVNGVINIITRNARDAAGGQLAVSAGDSLRGSLFVSRGIEVAPDHQRRPSPLLSRRDDVGQMHQGVLAGGARMGRPVERHVAHEHRTPRAADRAR
ncbi:MAG TPA: TonB-dependent receptor plug domain-containing protein, partial [Thauera sp.]|nr:TonB-dependent receptor plug domain-containing protein [Thauera sp.]